MHVYAQDSLGFGFYIPTWATNMKLIIQNFECSVIVINVSFNNVIVLMFLIALSDLCASAGAPQRLLQGTCHQKYQYSSR